MYKKTILSLAIASTLTLTGCFDSEGENTANEGVRQSLSPDEQPSLGDRSTAGDGAYPIFNPITGNLPIPTDINLQSGDDTGTEEVELADGSFNTDIVDSFETTTDPTSAAFVSPFTIQLGKLSGSGTSVPIDIPLSAPIDLSSVNAAPIILSGGAPVPNPLQNLFIIELDYASGNPIQGSVIGEPGIPSLLLTLQAAGGGDPTAIASLISLASNPEFDISTFTTTDGAHFLRISPIKPLKPGTRYLIAMTDEITDAEGNALIADPSVTGYGYLTDSDAPLASARLASLASTVNESWEPGVVAVFDNATNPSRDGIGADDLVEDDIVLSFTVTTSADQDVLGYLTDPSSFVANSLTELTSLTAISTALAGNPDLDYVGAATASATAIASFSAAAIDPTAAGCDVAFTAGTDRINCLAGAIAGSLAPILPGPAALTSSFDPATALDVNQVSSLLAVLGITPGRVSVNEGTLSDLPYYLGVPGEPTSVANGVPILTGSFTPDQDLADTLFATNPAFNFPQRTPDDSDTVASDVVNYIYPFPDETTTQDVAVLAIYPTGATLDAGSIKTVIFQHGIRADRSTALAIGAQIVNEGIDAGEDIAVIAIDQPLHGISPISTEQRADLAGVLLTSAGTINIADGITTEEQTTIDAVVGGVFSAGLVTTIDGACPFVDITASDLATVTTDILGGACDGIGLAAVLGSEPSVAVGGAQILERTVANGGSTIPGLAQGSADERHFGFGGRDNVPLPMVFDPDNAVGTNYRSSTLPGEQEGTGALFANLADGLVTRDNLRQGTLDLISLRLSIATMDLDNNGTPDLDANDVYFIGHSLGTINGLPFVDVVNKTTSTADDIVAAIAMTPGGGFARLAESSAFFSPAALEGFAAAGIPQGTANFELVLRIYQSAVDSGDAINFVEGIAEDGGKLLLSIVEDDNVIPNDPFTSPLGDALPATLAGGEIIATLTDATAITSADTGSSVALTQNVTRYAGDLTGATGGTHITPSYPSTGGAGELAMFAELYRQAASVIISGGATVDVTNTGNPIID